MQFVTVGTVGIAVLPPQHRNASAGHEWRPALRPAGALAHLAGAREPVLRMRCVRGTGRDGEDGEKKNESRLHTRVLHAPAAQREDYVSPAGKQLALVKKRCIIT